MYLKILCALAPSWFFPLFFFIEQFFRGAAQLPLLAVFAGQ